MQVKLNKIPGYFMIASRKGHRKIYIFPGSHYSEFHLNIKKRKLAVILKMNSFLLPFYFIFFGHRHLQHAGTEYPGHCNPMYHLFFVTKDVNLQEAIVLGYIWRLVIASDDEEGSSQ